MKVRVIKIHICCLLGQFQPFGEEMSKFGWKKPLELVCGRSDILVLRVQNLTFFPHSFSKWPVRVLGGRIGPCQYKN